MCGTLPLLTRVRIPIRHEHGRIRVCAGIARGAYGDFGLFDSGLVDGAIEIFELCAFQICFDHQKILT